MPGFAVQRNRVILGHAGHGLRAALLHFEQVQPPLASAVGAVTTTPAGGPLPPMVMVWEAEAMPTVVAKAASETVPLPP